MKYNKINEIQSRIRTLKAQLDYFIGLNEFESASRIRQELRNVDMILEKLKGFYTNWAINAKVEVEITEEFLYLN